MRHQDFSELCTVAGTDSVGSDIFFWKNYSLNKVIFGLARCVCIHMVCPTSEYSGGKELLSLCRWLRLSAAAYQLQTGSATNLSLQHQPNSFCNPMLLFY